MAWFVRWWAVTALPKMGRPCPNSGAKHLCCGAADSVLLRNGLPGTVLLPELPRLNLQPVALHGENNRHRYTRKGWTVNFGPSDFALLLELPVNKCLAFRVWGVLSFQGGPMCIAF